MDIDLEELAAMVELLKAADFSEFRYEKGDLSIVIRRGGLSSADDDRSSVSSKTQAAPVDGRVPRAMPTAGPSPAIAPVDGADVITAPLLGTFYARSKPGDAPFVKVGDTVGPDTVLCIVEVMKLMNSVTAGCSGVVAAVHADDGQLVEFGQPLFSIVSDAAQ
jgi:acetyl-CoA carboxylase biotin carboxyl carrier protein